MNNDLQKTRITNLDFLRGVVIVFAIQQHFAFYLNSWFESYFKDFEALSSTYKILLPLMNKPLPTDNINVWFAVVFTPWVSQIYLCLAAFNLAKRDQVSFEVSYWSKMKAFFLIFLIFALENFLVAPNLGEAISIYPIMLWMVVLAIIATVYKFMGVLGVGIVGLVCLFRFTLPVEVISNGFEEWVRVNIHPNFEYDAKLEYFILSGVLGFLIGHSYFHRSRDIFKKIIQLMILFSTAYFVGFLALGPKFTVMAENVLATEHDYARIFSGTLYVLSVMTIIIGSLLLLEIGNKKIKLRFINWIGENSILVFFVHRILITKVLIPLYLLGACLMGVLPQNRIIEGYVAITLVVLFSWYLKKSKITEMVIKN